MIVLLFLIISVQGQFPGPTDPADALQANRIIGSLVKAWDRLNFTGWNEHFDPNAMLETCAKDNLTPKEFMDAAWNYRTSFQQDFTMKYGLIYAYHETGHFDGITFKVHVQIGDNPKFHHDIRITLHKMGANHWGWVNAWQDNCANEVSHEPFEVKEEDLIVRKMKRIQPSSK